MLRFATSFHLTRPHGVPPTQTWIWPSVHAIAFRSWLPPIGSIKDFHLQSLNHAQRTRMSSSLHISRSVVFIRMLSVPSGSSIPLAVGTASRDRSRRKRGPSRHSRRTSVCGTRSCHSNEDDRLQATRRNRVPLTMRHGRAIRRPRNIPPRRTAGQP